MKYILKNIRRNKTSLILILTTNLNLVCFAQQDIFYKSHATYWYYRTRLRNDFLLVGPDQGMSIPMQERGAYYKPFTESPYDYSFNAIPNDPDGKPAQWGDAMSDLGYYIGVLATEYALLKRNNQKTDSTLKELYFALWALNRIDYNAETLYQYVTLNINQTTYGVPSYDGFMCRDDVDENFVKDNYSHFNYYGNRGFCSNIKINNSYDNSNGGHLTSWSAVSNGQDYHGSFISQDNWYDVLVGLSLVRKLIPAGEAYRIGGVNQTFQSNSPDANVSSLYDEAMNIANRVYHYFNVNRDIFGRIEYPDGNPIPSRNGGYVAPLSFAHSEIIGRMRGIAGWDYYNPTESSGNAAFHDECAKHAYLNTGNWFIDNWRASIGISLRALAWAPVRHNRSGLPYTDKTHEAFWRFAVNNYHNSNVAPMQANLQALCNCWYNFEENQAGDVMSVDEFSHSTASGEDHSSYNLYHVQLLRAVLNGWENCGYGEANSFPDWHKNDEMSKVWTQLLSSAPCETQYNIEGNTFHTSGPYSFNSAPEGPMNPFFEWSTTSRMDHPQRRGAGNNLLRGEYNGLDYMLYHNLFFMLRKSTNNDNSDYLVDFSNRYLALSYPLVGNTNTNSNNPWGSLSNPATVGAYEVINATCTINNNAIVNTIAGKEIQLQPGFSAISGCQFSAIIQHLDCSSIFNQDDSYDNINARSIHEDTIRKKNKISYAYLPTQYDSSSMNTIITKKGNNAIAKKSPYFRNTFKNKINLSDITSIYPNPTSGIIYLHVNNPSLVSRFEIQDLFGRNIQVNSSPLNQDNSIDLSLFSPGVYFARLTDINNNTIIKKIVKN